MPNYKKILEAGAAAVGLADDLELLRALHDIGKNWVELANKLNVANADAMIATVLADLNKPQVQQAFNTLGIAGALATLKRLVGKLNAAAGEVPPSVKQLLRPIADFDEARAGADNPGKLNWSLIDAKQELKPGDGLSLAVTAAGGLSVEAGDTWPFARDSAPDPLLRLGLSGKLGGSAGVTVPYSLGTVSGSVGASAGADINYYLDVRGSRSLYAVEVGKSLLELPDPFDFEAVWDAFAASNLHGITFDFTGQAKAALSVSLADSGRLFGVAAELGATVGAQVNIDTKYTLSFRRGDPAAAGGRQMIATLSRAKVNAWEASARIGVTFDLAKLASRVHDLLKSAIGEWDEALKEVKPFLSPGTWLQTQASDLIEAQAGALIGNTTLKDAIVRDLRGAIGIDTSDSALIEWLIKEMGGALDQASGVLTAKVDDAAGSAWAALSTRLPALSQGNLKQMIETSLKKLITDSRKRFEDEVRNAITAAGGDLQDALNRAGATTSGAVKKLDDALKPMRELIDKYDKLFKKVLAESQNAARRKISASLQLREARSSGENIEVLGTLRARSAEAEAVFVALTRGRLDAIWALFKPDAPDGDFALDPNSSLKRFYRSSSEFGLELILFGFGISGKELLESDVSVGVDGEGNLYIDTSTKLTKIFQALSEGAELSFADAFSIARLRATAALPGSGSRKLEVGVTVTHMDNSLKRSEIEDFVASLEAARLLAPGSKAAAVAKFDAWAGRGSDKPLAAHVTAKLWLTNDAAVRLMQLDSRTAADLSEQARANIDPGA